MSKIIGVGHYLPKQKISNHFFDQHVFMDESGELLKQDSPTVAAKLKDITGIEERRYAADDQVCSDLAFEAAKEAIEDAAIDPETLDYIIVAHNFGDVPFGTTQTDILPSIASRVKHHLKIKNPYCVCYDMIFGCPGWVEGLIQANAFIQAGLAKRCLVIGAETLSRVVDPHDRDSMIYADGAGAVVVEKSADNKGVKTHLSASFTGEECDYLFFGKSYNTSHTDNTRYIKMHGRKIYEFALKQVPDAMKKCLEESGIPLEKVKKILIHQANEKMDEAIVNRFYKLYRQPVPEGVMPMIIQYVGNSSVATIPSLLSLILKGELPGHKIEEGDVVLFASVGAGMNINAVVYQY